MGPIEARGALSRRAATLAALLFLLVATPAAGQEERVLVENPHAVALGTVTVGALDEQAGVAAVAVGEWGEAGVVLLDVLEDGLEVRTRVDAPGSVRWLGWSRGRLLAWVGWMSWMEGGSGQRLYALDPHRLERGWLDGGEIPGCDEEEPNAVVAGEQVFLRTACRDSWFYNRSQVHRFSVAGPGPPVLVDTPIHGAAYGPIAGGGGTLINPRYGCDEWSLSGRSCQAPFRDIDIFEVPSGGAPSLKSTIRRRAGFSAGILSRNRLLSLPYHTCNVQRQLRITHLDPGWDGQRTVPRDVDCGATWIAEHDDRVLLGNEDSLWLTDLTFGGPIGKREELPQSPLAERHGRVLTVGADGVVRLVTVRPRPPTPRLFATCGTTNQDAIILRGDAPEATRVVLSAGDGAGSGLTLESAAFETRWPLLPKDQILTARAYGHGGASRASERFRIRRDDDLPFDPLETRITWPARDGNTRARRPVADTGCADPKDWVFALPHDHATSLSVPVTAGVESMTLTLGLEAYPMAIEPATPDPADEHGDRVRRVARVDLPARREMAAVEGRVAFDLHIQTGGEVLVVPGSVALDRAFLPSLMVSR